MATTDNTVLYIVVAIVALHFVVGIGWLVWKIGRAKPHSPPNQPPTERP